MFGVIKSWREIVFRMPMLLRDYIVVKYLDMPACEGHYDRYEDIIYGEDDFFSKLVLNDTLRLLRESQSNTELNISDNQIFIMAALSIAKEKKKNPLTVLDIGGSHGDAYFMSRNTFGEDYFLNWIVIEAAPKVEFFDQQEVEDKVLSFEKSIDKIEKCVDVVIISGTLQYLPSPLDTLRKVLTLNPSPQCIVITNTPYWDRTTRLTRQLSHKRRESFHRGRLALPFWLLNETEVFSLFRAYRYQKAADQLGRHMYVTGLSRKYSPVLTGRGFLHYRALLFTLQAEAVRK